MEKIPGLLSKNFGKIFLGCLLGLGLPSIAPPTCVYAQIGVPGHQLAGSKALAGPEQLNYSVYFTWGIIRGKAGEAVILTRKTRSRDQWFHQLRFRTAGVFETIFPMRDTLETLYAANYQPLRWEKRVNEGGNYLVDEITYTPINDKWRIHSKRYDESGVKIDTAFLVSNKKAVVDLLSTISLVRNIDPAKVKLGYSVPFIVVIGKTKVDCNVSYSGKDVMQMPSGESIETIRMDLNIQDEAFQNATRSAEIWLTNDERLVPLKIRAKLKIGYAECNLDSVTTY